MLIIHFSSLFWFVLYCLVYTYIARMKLKSTLNNISIFLFYLDFHSLCCTLKLSTESNGLESIKIWTNANNLVQREQIMLLFVQIKYTINLKMGLEADPTGKVKLKCLLSISLICIIHEKIYYLCVIVQLYFLQKLLIFGSHFPVFI